MAEDGVVVTRDEASAAAKPWTLLTSHGRVLVLIARNPDLRIRDLAQLADITERSAQAIVTDLEEVGYIDRERVGRRNSYRINRDLPFRHSAESDHTVGELIDLFATTPRRHNRSVR
jgi:hypothetical protein